MIIVVTDDQSNKNNIQGLVSCSLLFKDSTEMEHMEYAFVFTEVMQCKD